ncbi:MAG: hypothetical protein GWO20_13295, partial [Candidatus Korarchaeota archaeon]|nr:hypothetical protein [Candidatus Korarchaeota archaeon]
EPVANLLVGFDVTTWDGIYVYRTYDLEHWGQGLRSKGRYVSEFEMTTRILREGTYIVYLLVGIHRVRWISRGQIARKLIVSGARTSDVTYLGVLNPPGKWKITKT